MKDRVGARSPPYRGGLSWAWGFGFPVTRAYFKYYGKQLMSQHLRLERGQCQAIHSKHPIISSSYPFFLLLVELSLTDGSLSTWVSRAHGNVDPGDVWVCTKISIASSTGTAFTEDNISD